MKITPKKIYIFCLIIFIIAVSIFSIYNHIVENYRAESDDPIMLTVKEKLKLIHPDVSRLEFYESNKSYTINKQKVHLCLKDKNGDYYNENMLTYVGLHELAHVLCDEVGHTEKFYRVFDDLLDKAHEMGLYDPSIPIIQDYCMH
jgi:hypothetical protein